MLKKILIIFLVYLLLFFIFKDRLLKVGISYILNEKFSLESEIEKAKLNFNGITLEGFNVRKDDLSLGLKKARVTFNLFNREIDELEISGCNLKFGDINASLALEKSKGVIYVLDVLSLKFKDKEVKNISIPLAIDADVISFSRIDSDFLGYPARISGILDYRDHDNICLELNLEDASFKNAVSFFSKKDDFVLVGNFDGGLKLCLGRDKISKIEGAFYNTNGGVVNIKKEASLDFLRRYLNKASYDALVDNFKHYTYNRGSIKIAKQRGVITLSLDFDSDDLGRRNILVNLHDIFGGRE